MTGQAAGWYYAEGDPAGTHRYWDGTGWQGGPQPVAGAGQAPAPGQVAGSALGGRQKAENGPRFVAALIDAAIAWVVPIVLAILAGILGQVSGALGGIMWVITFLSFFAVWIYNMGYLQGTTGQSIGKKQQGITLLSKETGQPVGFGMAIVRGLLGGALASVCYLDIIWILIDENNQRLSDNILNNNVVTA